jgi:hypothetical protein
MPAPKTAKRTENPRQNETGPKGAIRGPAQRHARLAPSISDFQNLLLDRFLIFRNNATQVRPSRHRERSEHRMQYFVVMIDYGRRGREAIVDPEITRREVVSRVASGEYKNISFIHEIADSSVEDITDDILAEAAVPEIAATDADLQASRFDHVRDLRKHETA